VSQERNQSDALSVLSLALRGVIALLPLIGILGDDVVGVGREREEIGIPVEGICHQRFDFVGSERARQLRSLHL